MAQGKVLPARSRKGSRIRVQRYPPAGHWPGRHALVVACRSRGTPRWWDICAPPLNAAPGHVIRDLFVSKDASRSITRRMTYQTIALELRHRLRNAFALSRAVIRISARTSPEQPSFAEALVTRFSSFAVAQVKPEGHCARFSSGRPCLRSRQSSRRKCAGLRCLSSSGMPRREPHSCYPDAGSE
jgi:hypothetical protein